MKREADDWLVSETIARPTQINTWANAPQQYLPDPPAKTISKYTSLQTKKPSLQRGRTNYG